MAGTRSAQLDPKTRFDLERTRIAYEQSMQSWIRTGTSLITFGFSIYKFFQIETSATALQARLIGPREFAVVLVVIGIAAIVLATFQHRANIRFLRQQYQDMPQSLAGVLAALISILGMLALVAVIFRQ